MTESWLKLTSERKNGAASQSTVHLQQVEPLPTTVSGRPELGEYPAYLNSEISLVEGDDIVQVLVAQFESTLDFLAPINETHFENRDLSSTRRTLRQVVGHLGDMERILSARALCIARNEVQRLSEFHLSASMNLAKFDERVLPDLLNEFRVIRKSTIALFRGISGDTWIRRAPVGGNSVTVRGVAFQIAAHEQHHINSLRQKCSSSLRTKPTRAI
jgi:hypothetical protein